MSHLKVNESKIDDPLSKTIAFQEKYIRPIKVFGNFHVAFTNYNTVKSTLSEVDEKWSHLGDLESS